MSGLFNLDNPIWRFMGKLVDVFILNLLWTVCLIPLIAAFGVSIYLPPVLFIVLCIIACIPIGPASTAVYYVTLKLVRDEESYTVRSFIKSFKENFKQASLIGTIMIAIGLFFAYDIYLYFAMGTQVMTILGIVFLGIFLLYLLTMVYIFPLQAKFYNTIRHTMRNALFMSVKHLFRSFIMIVIAVAVCVACLVFYPLILLSYALIAFLQSYFLVGIFDKYIPKEDDEKRDSFEDSLGIEEEAAEQTHIVMTQEDTMYNTGNVLSRDMLENKNDQQ